jgi:hypothetical protein
VQAWARPGKPISSIFELLRDKTERPMTVEEINEASAAGWSGER